MTAPEIVPVPDGIQVTRDGLDTIVQRRWWSWKTIPLLVFCVFWNGFVVVWLTITLAMGARPLALFGLIHAVIGVALIYAVLAGFLNVTDVAISTAGVRVRTHPLPWRGNLSVASAELAELHTCEVVHHRRGGRSYSYEIHAKDRSDRERILLRGLGAFEQAAFIERAIAEAFGIPAR
jgi:hypothetical protein